MTSYRAFKPDDLFRISKINMDPLTETYNLSFYLQYLAQWPDLFLISDSNAGEAMGYIMGKAEGEDELWHGHVSAVTVSPTFRRMAIARKLMKYLEDVSENVYSGYFVDLFVRQSNNVAIAMYEQFGYIVYRRVIEYYTGSNTEDALDMRKALSRDVDKKSVVPLLHPIRPEDLEWQ